MLLHTVMKEELVNRQRSNIKMKRTLISYMPPTCYTSEKQQDFHHCLLASNICPTEWYVNTNMSQVEITTHKVEAECCGQLCHQH